MRTRGLIAAIIAAVALGGCGNGDDAQRETVTVIAGAPTATAPPQADPQRTAPEPSTRAGQENARPAGEGQTYRVRDAGEVTVAREGDRLRLVGVTPAAGWSHRVTEQESQEIEITFRGGGREIEFEAELEDGRVVTDIDD